MSPEFRDMDDEQIRMVLRRGEMDLRLSRNDPERSRRIGVIVDAALAELLRRLVPDEP
jgi:hypothetical protein